MRANPALIQQMILDNPCVDLPNNQVRTCPVRLSFPALFRPGRALEEGKEPKFQATLLFPVGADIGVLKRAAGRTAIEKFGESVPAGSLKTPFRDQGEKAHLEGYTPGGIFLTATGLQKPLLVDSNGKVVTEESRVYPGVWALAVLRPFAFTTPRKGVSFGLQSVMLIADDDAFGGSGPQDPNELFGGVKLSGGGAAPIAAGAAQNAADLF